jgi:integrase
MDSGEGSTMKPYLRGKTYWISFKDQFGRRISKSAQTEDPKEAQARLASLETKVREGKFFDKRQQDRIRFKDLLDQVRKYEMERSLGSYNAFAKSYYNKLESVFGEKYLEEITPRLLEKYQVTRAEETSKATSNLSLAVLKKVFNLGMRWDLTNTNPATKVKPFKVPRGRMRFLLREEQEDLLKVCKKDLKDVVLVAMRTGMRRGELLGLRKKDVDFRRNFIYLEKTKSGTHRQIPMTPEVREVMTRLAFGHTDDDLLFRNRAGEPYVDLRTAFKTALSRAEIKEFHFHDLRHTYASDMVMSGVSIFVVSKLLGHSSVQTTMIYAHLALNHNKAEMERYDRYLHPATNPLQSAQAE